MAARVRLVLCLAATLAVTVAPLPVGASVAPGDQSGDETSGDSGAGAVRRLGESLALPEGMSGRSFWVSPELNRAYFLQEEGPLGSRFPAKAAFPYGNTLAAVDLATGKVVGAAALDPAAWGGGGDSAGVYTGSTYGRDHVVAMDHERARLFVPYGARGAVDEVETDPPCVSTGFQAKPMACVGGFHVVDGATMAVVRTVPLPPVQVDSASGMSELLLAIQYSPPAAGESGEGKIHLLLEQYANHVADPLAYFESRSYGQFSVVTASQFDVATGQRDWAVRVAACRGTRDQMADPQYKNGTMGRPYPASIHRSLSEPAMWVGCAVSGAASAVVTRIPLDASGKPHGALPVQVGDPGAVTADEPDGGGDVVSRTPGQDLWVGPAGAVEFRPDPTSGRIVVRANTGYSEMWWVFDEAERAYIGGIGIGAYERERVAAVFDERTGRLYVATQPDTNANMELGDGGLYVADIRRTPLPQAVYFPEFADLVPANMGLRVLSHGSGAPRRIYRPTPKGESAGVFDKYHHNGRWEVLEEDLAVTQDIAAAPEATRRSLDLVEQEGVTAATYDGAARGYGARAILVGGVGAATRPGVAPDALTTYEAAIGVPRHAIDESTQTGDLVDRTPARQLHQRCVYPDREIVLGFVGPDNAATVDGGGSRGSAQPLVTDERSGGDAQAPLPRCTQYSWDEAWQTALFSGAPADQPGVPWMFSRDESQTSCVSGADESGESWNDPYLGWFEARVECQEAEAGGRSQAQGLKLDDLSVAEAISNFRIYRDPERGLVSRVESIARGIDIGGVIKIDTVRGAAESWANGRAVAQEAEAPGAGPAFNPHNCDRARTAGTCFERQVFGVRVSDGKGGAAYQCGPCGDEGALTAALDAALGTNGTARFRDPDPELARGTDDGYIAAIQKPDSERFADLILNNDLLQTTVPTLEIIRYAPGQGARLQAETPPGRQVFQFAGVEVSSTYGIQCLLVLDEEAGTCGARPEELGSLTVTLADGEGGPLAGGAFEVRRDADGDGVAGLADELLPDGACLTAEDGVGTCVFEALQPGGFLVSQIAAPPGYAPAAEPWLSDVGPGEARTVTFTNTTNLSTVDVTATHADGTPLPDVTFAVYPDPDADGKVAPGADPAAMCTTDDSGTCSMTVPAGSYVLVQITASGELEPIEPVAFTFASAGQVAAVRVVNQAPDGSPAAGPAPSPAVGYTSSATPPPLESVTGYAPAEEPASPPPVSLPEALGGTVVRVIRAPGEALRLLARDPVQAAAWMASLALLGLAIAAVRRRVTLGELTAVPVGALAFTGPGAAPPPGPAGLGGPAPRRPESGAPAGGKAATAVLDRPVVAGAAPAVTEGPTARVVAATASGALAAVISERLSKAGTCALLGVADSVEALRALVAAERPDVLIVDLALPTGRPEDICDLLPDLHPPGRTVGIIPPNRSPEALATRGQAVGIPGLLVAMDDIGNGHLAYAVRCVAGDRPCYGPTVQALLLQRSQTRATRRRGPTGLTERELEVARLAADGASRTEIAELLFLSPGTVKRHLRAVRAKLGVANPWDQTQLRLRLDESLRSGEGAGGDEAEGSGQAPS